CGIGGAAPDRLELPVREALREELDVARIERDERERNRLLGEAARVALQRPVEEARERGLERRDQLVEQRVLGDARGLCGNAGWPCERTVQRRDFRRALAGQLVERR